MTNTLSFCLLLMLFARPLAAHEDHSQHAHAAPSTVIETAAAAPTLHAESPQFELVGRLYEKEFGLYVDRWASNAPLLNADIEVELNGRKAKAAFHPDHGDYALVDPEMLKALRTPGDHALVFSVIAGEESDLLTSVLHVEAEDRLAAVSDRPGVWWLFGAFGAVLLIGCGLGIRHVLVALKEKRV